MTVPSITSVTPNEGHSGGKTLIEIVGTGFAVPFTPDSTGPTTPLSPSVSVTIGERACTNVAVVSDTLIYCLTPKGDVGETDYTFTIDDPDDDQLVITGHTLANDTPVTLSSTSALPAPFAPDTCYFIVDADTDVLSLAATPGGLAIDIEDAGSGTLTLTTARRSQVVLQNLDDEGNAVSGEVAFYCGFTYQRPDLSEESELARVVRAFMQELKRQIIPNVNLSTHTDYDAATGDLLNLTYVEELPAIVLANLEIPEDRIHAVQEPPDFDQEDDRFIERRPAVAVDVTCTLVGVSDNPVEILNLMQVVRMFFKKNPYLELDRATDHPEYGTVKYEMDFSFAGPVSVTHQGDNSNVESFGGQIAIRGVILEDMPGITRAKPPGIAAKYPHEATTGFGWKSAEDETAVQRDVQKKTT